MATCAEFLTFLCPQMMNVQMQPKEGAALDSDCAAAALADDASSRAAFANAVALALVLLPPSPGFSLRFCWLVLVFSRAGPVNQRGRIVV